MSQAGFFLLYFRCLGVSLFASLSYTGNMEEKLGKIRRLGLSLEGDDGAGGTIRSCTLSVGRYTMQFSFACSNESND